MPLSVLGDPRAPQDADAEKLPLIGGLLEQGKRYRDEMRKTQWETAEKQYSGDHWSISQMEDDTADRITVNMSFSTVTTIAPYVTGEPPVHIVKPVSTASKESHARLIEAWLDRLWRRRDTDYSGELRDAVEDFLVYGDGWLRVGYEIVQVPVGSQDYAEAARLTLDRITPYNVWVDPWVERYQKATWVAIRTYLTVEELLDTPYFDEDGETVTVGDRFDRDDIPIIVTREDADFRTAATPHHVDGERQYVELIEFFDILERKQYRYVSGMDVPLYVAENVEPPLVNVANHRIFRSPYHMGELEQIWGIQQELNYARSQLATHRRRNVTKVFVRSGALGEGARSALESPRMGEVVELDVAEPIENVMKPFQLPPLSAEAYNSGEQAVRDIFEVTGVTEYLRGSPQADIRRTATEATILESGSNVKVRAKLDRIERAIREVGYLLVSLAKDVYTETNFDELELLLGGDYADRFNRAAAAEQNDPTLVTDPGEVSAVLGVNLFEGAYDIDVEKASTELRNPQVREQRFRQLFETVMQYSQVLPQMGVQINARYLLEQWLDAIGLTDTDAVFTQPGLQGLPQPAQPGAAQQPQGGLPPGLPPGILQGAPADVLGPQNTGTLPPVG